MTSNTLDKTRKEESSENPPSTSNKNAVHAAKKENDDSNPQQGGSGSSKGSSANSTGGAMTDNKQEKPKQRVPPTKKDNRKLFVGGLPSNVTETEFREFFEQYGQLVDSVVMFDRDTRRSRGFGFVTFEDPAVPRSLLTTVENGKQTGRVTMRGKVCEVKAAEPREWSSGGVRRGNRDRNRYNRKQQQHMSPAGHASAGEMVAPNGISNVVPVEHVEFAPGSIPPTTVGAWPYAQVPAAVEEQPMMVQQGGYVPVVPGMYYPGGGIPPVVPANVNHPVQYNPYMAAYTPQGMPVRQDIVPGMEANGAVAVDPSVAVYAPQQVPVMVGQKPEAKSQTAQKEGAVSESKPPAENKAYGNGETTGKRA